MKFTFLIRFHSYLDLRYYKVWETMLTVWSVKNKSKPENKDIVSTKNMSTRIHRKMKK